MLARTGIRAEHKHRRHGSDTSQGGQRFDRQGWDVGGRIFPEGLSFFDPQHCIVTFIIITFYQHYYDFFSTSRTQRASRRARDASRKSLATMQPLSDRHLEAAGPWKQSSRAGFWNT